MRRVLCVSILVVTLAGISSPAQAVEEDTTKPVVTLTSPSTPFQLEPIAATWTGTDGDGSGIDGYQVRHKKARGDEAFGEIITTGLEGDQTSFEVESLPGVTYCFSVAARDLAGNISAFTPWRCTSLPVDDALFEDVDFAWDEVADDDTYWNETVTRTIVLGAKMKSPVEFALQIKRVGVVATVCPTCGSVRLKVGTTTLGTISLVAPETKHQRIRMLPVFPLVTGRLKVITTTSGKPVEIDGVAFSRK